MSRERPTAVLHCFIALSLGCATASHAFPNLPEPPPFTSFGTTRIDVTDVPSPVLDDCGLAASSAIPNDGLDDGCPIQAALDAVAAAGGGVVYFPAGTYNIDRTLVVDNHTWVVGAGSDTLLVRGSSAFSHRTYGPDCTGPTQVSSHQLFVNADYNCGNRGITLFNFAIDGSDVPVQGSPTIGFSAVTDTHVWNLHIEDSQGDAIAFRNGGVRTSVRNTTVRGFRGAGFRAAMFSDSYIGDRSDSLPNRRPAVILFGNTIESQAGQSADQYGISFSRPEADVPGEAPRALIQNNKVDVTDGQTGISCLECVDTTITGNGVVSVASAGDGTFTGIHATGRNLRLLGNRVIGNGVPGDGRGILVSSPASTDIANTDAVVIGNRVSNKSIQTGLVQTAAAVEVSGLWRFTVKNNTVDQISGGPGIAIGDCVSDLPGTSKGFVASNAVTMASGDRAPGYVVRRTGEDIHFMNNLLDDDKLNMDDVQLCQSQPPSQH